MSRDTQPGNDLPADLKDYLPERTADAWVKLAPLVPSSAYLAGGTGLTVHLHHRVSRDLDFMLRQPEDLARLRRDRCRQSRRRPSATSLRMRGSGSRAGGIG